ncbi:MAG: DNA mismatch repair endonuclease MutL [Promethearchaeota archaeon]
MIRRKIKRIIDAEKIAAGEVVERPANIVKELIENSIDAGADEIRVIVKKAGKVSIQVIDNGTGISPEEMEIAFERHTSSKIRSIEDLDNLTTLGFRGEALASIAAVSRIEITSRTEQNDRGVQLQIEGGIIKNRKEVSCQIGTNIKVNQIFYNIPARQKFLKKDSTELGHITDIMQRYSLAFPELHFIYRHNELDILNCPSNNDLKTTVFHIYGKNNAKYMESIGFKDKDSSVQIHGLLGHPQIAKKSRSYSSLFINNRYVISDVLFRSIMEAYEGTLMVSKYPFFVLFLELDPSVVDFNVHPKKLEVRFENENALCNRIYNIIRSFIEEKFVEKEAKYIDTDLEDFLPWITDDQGGIEINSRNKQKLKDSTEKNTGASAKESSLIEESVQLNLLDEKVENGGLSESYLRRKYTISKDFPKLRLISSTGQLANKTYVILEGINEYDDVGIFILDQHAASERIKKEKLLASYETTRPMKQKLIQPLKIDITPSEKIFLEDNLIEIKKLGFDFEYFGGNTFILREIPTIMNKLPEIGIIKEIISDITEIGKDKSFKVVKEEIINYIACHKSIRGGDELSLSDIRNLLNELAECNDSYHCAHGRPTLRFISFRELDKLFKRIV